MGRLAFLEAIHSVTSSSIARLVVVSAAQKQMLAQRLEQVHDAEVVFVFAATVDPWLGVLERLLGGPQSLNPRMLCELAGGAKGVKNQATDTADCPPVPFSLIALAQLLRAISSNFPLLFAHHMQGDRRVQAKVSALYLCFFLSLPRPAPFLV